VIPALGTEMIGNFDSPIYVAQAPGSTDTLWIVEQGGTIRLVRDGATLPTPFLDISAGSIIDAGGEQGLLGLAFHPDYAANGRFFVYYTANGGNNVVAEYRRSAGNPDVADPMQVSPRLVDEPDSEGNHNGGMITFGPDGFLYVGMGDEGGGCDRHGAGGNAQNLDTLFGKILRLDVDAAGADFAAAGNPFSGAEGLPQIWAYGLRNPWRFSFDRMTDELYIGDVGQNRQEEISYQAAGSAGGLNYGWRVHEGDLMNTCMDTTLEGPSAHTPPILALDQGAAPLDGSCAVVGGYVYRGSAIPGLRGVYLFGDNCSRNVAAFRYCDGMVRGVQEVTDLERGGNLASFGEDLAGELYLMYVGSGAVLKIVPG
jgi:glucose/arabinose dehydrogenase